MILRPNAGFIIPTRRFIDVGMPAGRMACKGRYKLRKLKNGIYTGWETPWFDNIILDSGLNRWGTGTIILGAAIGTSSAAPDAAQTGLLAESTYTTTSGTGAGSSALGSSPYNNTRTFAFRTALGALSGNYNEVGVGWASGAMFSRALILDGMGAPTSIPVAVDEQLDILYQLSVFPPLTDTFTTVTISGVDYDVTGRASMVNQISGAAGWQVVQSAMAIGAMTGNATAYTGAIGVVTAGPAGTAYSGSMTAASGAYVNNSMQRAGSTSFSLTQGNLAGGITSTRVWWNNTATFQYQFNPVLPKDGTKSLVLNYTINWGRRP